MEPSARPRPCQVAARQRFGIWIEARLFQVAQYAPQMSSTINLVAATLGVSIVPTSISEM